MDRKGMLHIDAPLSKISGYATDGLNLRMSAGGRDVTEEHYGLIVTSEQTGFQMGLES